MENKWFDGASWSLVKVCQTWGIPFLSLDEVDPGNIGAVIEGMDPKPRVILSTITRVSEEAVQKQLRRLPVKTICLDESQVPPRSSHRPDHWLAVHR